MITLRPYQTDGIRMIKEEWLKGKKRVVVVYPTGSGKTVLFSYMAQLAAKKHSHVLVITHRDELLGQTGGTLRDFDLDPYVITSKTKRPPTNELCVAMTKTLSNRLYFQEWVDWYKKIDLIIIDEMHIQEMNWIFDHTESKGKYILGFSATPGRKGNQRQLSEDYESMVIGPDVQELINQKYLVPDRYFCVPVDMTGVSKSNGDYNTEEMFSRYNKTELYSGVIDNWKRICPNTITIVFCCNIQHTINTCRAFNEAGIPSKFIVSTLSVPKKPAPDANKGEHSKYLIKCQEYENFKKYYELYSGDRDEVVSEWKEDGFKVLINAGIATTGFDHKPIQTVIINRATTSENLLLQMCGRGSRIFKNKDYFYFLDFGENCKRLGYYRQEREYSLTHEKPKAGSGVAASKECPKCHALVIASSTVCKYCGFIFPKSHEEKIVELTEVNYKEASKKLQTIEDYEIFAKAKGYNKNWLSRQIFIKWGKEGLQQYAKAKGHDNYWVHLQTQRYRSQGIRTKE